MKNSSKTHIKKNLPVKRTVAVKKTGRQKGRCTKAEKDKRINDLIQCVREGWSFTKMFEKYSKEWDIGKRAFYDYIETVQQILKEVWEKESGEMLTTTNERLKMISEYAFRDGKYDSSIKAEELRLKLAGLLDKTKFRSEIKLDLNLSGKESQI